MSIYFFDENRNRTLIQTSEIDEVTPKLGQIDYFYSSPCEEYQQFFEIEFLGEKFLGSFKTKPFYEPKTCCSKHCYSGIIYYQEIQGRVKTIPEYSSNYVSFSISL